MATKNETERLSVVETKVDRAVSDIAEVKTSVTEGFATLNTKIDNLDKKYAAKWVQSAVTFVVGIIVAAVLTALIALVIVPNTRHNPTSTTTNNTTTTSTPSTGSTGSGTPSANANASAQSTPANPSDSQSSSSGGLLNEVPKL